MDALEPTRGQKLAGLMLRVFGLLILFIATGVFGIVVIVCLAMENDWSDGGWIAVLLIACGSLLAMGLGGLMDGLGSLLCGVVRLRTAEHRWKWCLVRCFRDPLILTGGYFLSGAGVFGGVQAWAPAGTMFVIAVPALVGGVVLTRLLRRIVRAGRRDVAGMG
ncbi:MAG: hypothetical protein O3A92_06320 [Verrucomicrobia bacterium]|nr:hypothetical protein [Verrucomicrobiota bacterium]